MPRKNSKQIKYISLTEATKYCDYTQQYLSLRARQGELKAKKFGRNWATTKKWVEEYLDKTNSQKPRVKNKKTHRSLFSTDTYFSAFAGAFEEVGKTIKKSKTIFHRPKLRYAIASVLVFIFFGSGFVWAGPTLLFAKDSFVEGFAVFSEEVNQGISNFSQDVYLYSDTANKVVKVPSVSIPPAPRINIPSSANFSIAISESFPSTITGARGVVENFRDVKNYASDKIASAGQAIALGAKYTFITIAYIPPTVVNNIFVVSDDIENRIFEKTYSPMSRFSIIAHNEFYDLGYTGRMVSEYTQWLNQKFVPEPLYTAKENVALGAASISNSCKSFYNKYVSKKIK